MGILNILGIKKRIIKTVNPYYKELEDNIKKIVQGYSKLLIIQGRGGTGKSHNIKKILENEKAVYERISGDITPAYLYKFLYDHNNKIIWFNDIGKLLREIRSVELLKAATETEEPRVLHSHNYNRANEELPSNFTFLGKLIFDINSLKGIKNMEDFRALVTRGEYILLNPSIKEIKKIMLNIATTSKDKETTIFLISHLPKERYNDINFRTQKKALNNREWAEKNDHDWKKVILQQLKNTGSEEERMLRDIIIKPITKRELIKTLLSTGYINSVRTGERRVKDWVYLGWLYDNGDKRNGKVDIKPFNKDL